MSLDLYYTALRFHNGIGVAKRHGTTVTIGTPPDLGSGPCHRVVYTPEIDEAQVTMHNSEPLRRMTRAEIKAADELLEHLCRERDRCHYSEPWKEGRC